MYTSRTFAHTVSHPHTHSLSHRTPRVHIHRTRTYIHYRTAHLASIYIAPAHTFTIVPHTSRPYTSYPHTHSLSHRTPRVHIHRTRTHIHYRTAHLASIYIVPAHMRITTHSKTKTCVVWIMRFMYMDNYVHNNNI